MSAQPVDLRDYRNMQAPNMQARILLVEDESDIAALTEMHLRDAAFDVRVANDGSQWLTLASLYEWDLVILDIRLPGVDGLEICKRLRASGDKTPIVFVSAKTTELDRVLGLELGADDYIVKPFSVLELTARVKALLRRQQQLAPGNADAQDSGRLQIGDLRADTGLRSVHVDERPVELTAREFDLLVHFMRSPGRVFNRAELLDQVWG